MVVSYFFDNIMPKHKDHKKADYYVLNIVGEIRQMYLGA